MKYHFFTTVLGCVLFTLCSHDTIAQQTTRVYATSENAASMTNDWQVYDSLGDAYMFEGDTASAIYNYQKAIELHPSDNAHNRSVEKLKQAYMEQTKSFYLKEY